jgi:hypothetical protein
VAGRASDHVTVRHGTRLQGQTVCFLAVEPEV